MCLGQIREGADFGELASSISDCQATRAKGGEVRMHAALVRAFPTLGNPSVVNFWRCVRKRQHFPDRHQSFCLSVLP